MATISDVAKYANVSKMTVSRVLNNNGYVKEQTRQAVMEAVRALNYRPNLLAKSLVTGRTNTIAYVLPDICDPYFGNVCKGTTDVCLELGYNFIITNAASAESLEHFINMVIDRKVDGVIFHHLSITAQQVQLLRDNGISSVLIDNETLLDNAIDITNDNYRGACMATEHLIQQGYRHIACVRGDLPREQFSPQDLNFAESFQERIWADRTRGFLDTMGHYGLKPFSIYHGRGSAAMDKAFLCGQQIMQQILELPPDQRPDAIYCQSDMIALGLLGEMLEQGVRCPDEIALCGHDGLDTCRYLYPRITTVVQPQYEIGRMAATTLIAAIEGQPQPDTELSSTLFLGDTTK